MRWYGLENTPSAANITDGATASVVPDLDRSRRSMRVILHLGADKTGTSAIQAALSALREPLSAAGIFYPRGHDEQDLRAESGLKSEGNAIALGNYLHPTRTTPNIPREEAVAWLDKCVAQAKGRDILFSSETLQTPDVSPIEELADYFGGHGYDISIIYYLRHALDQAVAAYLQHLKRGFSGVPRLEKVRDLSTFLETYKIPYAQTLNRFSNRVPHERMSIRLFDTERRSLVPGFLKLISNKTFDIPTTERIINRSPSPAEQIVFEELANLPNGPRLCRTVGELWLNRPTKESTDNVVTEAAFEVFRAGNQPIVDQINKRFLTGPEKLAMKSERIAIGDPPEVPIKQVYAKFAEAFALLEAQRREVRPGAVVRPGGGARPGALRVGPGGRPGGQGPGRMAGGDRPAKP